MDSRGWTRALRHEPKLTDSSALKRCGFAGPVAKFSLWIHISNLYWLVVGKHAQQLQFHGLFTSGPTPTRIRLGFPSRLSKLPWYEIYFDNPSTAPANYISNLLLLIADDRRRLTLASAFPILDIHTVVVLASFVSD